MMTSEAIILSRRLANHDNIGDREGALVDLVDHATESLRRYVKAHAPYELVEEICAETWKIMLEHVSAGVYEDREDDPIKYMIGIAKYVSLRQGTRQRRAHLVEIPLDESTEPAVEGVGMDLDEKIDLASLRRVLSDPEDQAVLQALLADQTIAEMAEAWNCHYKTAWRRFHRFLDHSRAALDADGMPA